MEGSIESDYFADEDGPAITASFEGSFDTPAPHDLEEPITEAIEQATEDDQSIGGY